MPEIANIATGSAGGASLTFSQAGISPGLPAKENAYVNGSGENLPELMTDDDSAKNHNTNHQTKRLRRNSQLTACAPSGRNHLRQKLQHGRVGANEVKLGIPSRKVDSDDEEDDGDADDDAVTVIVGRFQWGCPSQDAGSENSETVLRIDRLSVPRGTYVFL